VQDFLHRDGFFSLGSSYIKSLFRKNEAPQRKIDDYLVHGIDVSYYQGKINWKKVKQHKAAFAFIRATQGKNKTDTHFARNWKSARKAGIIRGAYHFFTPSLDATAQADNFIKRVTLESGDLPPVLDVERTEGQSADKIREGVSIWLEAAEEEYGLTPILYTNYRFYQRYLEGHFDRYPVWIAHYTKNSPAIAHESGWTFWQHSETGKVPGISKNVDMNVFSGSLENLTSLCKP
ncbi:MAG: glycoside hydrolase family 25 protein, partial [Chitinophagaceae bacterium]